MNRKLYKSLQTAILLMIFSQVAYAQNKLGFVQQENIKVSGITQDSLIYPLTDVQKQTTRTYLDGMGRGIQSIVFQASPLQNDMIQPVVYDNLGRQTKSYLPYAGQSTDTTGNYRINALTAQHSFYNNTSQYIVARDTNPFAQQVYEASPLQRMLQAGTVGVGFQPVSGQHYKTVSYRFNKTADGNILVWNANGTFTTGTYYPANTLSVTDGTDEDNTETLSFADAAGHLILKRQILSGGNLDTYYIYNMAGMISYVIPPLATVKLAANSYNLATAPLKNLVFKLVYDNMGRPVEKTVPAKGKMCIVYDPLNRPVLTQDSTMRTSNKWVYIKYDVKGRVINQGTYTDATHTTRTTMQTYVSGLTYTTWYESRTTATGFNYYTNVVFPTSVTPLSYIYYDDYDVNNDGAADFAYTSQGLPNEGSQTTAPIKGMPTITLQSTIGAGLTSTFLTKVIFYDKRGNTIQTKSSNQVYYPGGLATTDVSTVVPDFVGVPQVTKVSKKTAAATTITVQTSMSYDHMYRVKSVSQSYNGGTSAVVAAYSYNELGQGIKKGLGFVSGTTYLQNVDMRYNIRGQLLTINNSKLKNDTGKTSNDSNDLFGMQMLYDQVDANLGNTAYYNGKLSAVKWMSKDGSGTSSYERAFRYYYDALNRDTAAIYAERTTAGTGSFTTTNGWNENRITYDQNGNLLTLFRDSTSQGSGGHTPIDNLSYTYDTNNPNQLTKVTDGTGTNYTNSGFRNRTGSTGSYTYDGNGNLTADPYKGITKITYNLLNRTDTIKISSTQYICYTYDGSGNLIRKQAYKTGTTTQVTDYVDGFVYNNSSGTEVLAYFPMPEGRVLNNAGTLSQEFIIADQQGNARISFNNTGTGGTAKVVQENSYYAFGLIMPGSTVATPATSNKQLYNGGSEWQNDYSNLPDYYQTYYRNYDAAIGRWVGVDPVAESAESMSSYQYAGNNPIVFNDPLGDELGGGVKIGNGVAYDPSGNVISNNQPTPNNSPYLVGNLAPSSGPLDSDWQNEGAFASNDYAGFWNSLVSDVNSYIATNGPNVNSDLGGVSNLYKQYLKNGDNGLITAAIYNNDDSPIMGISANLHTQTTGWYQDENGKPTTVDGNSAIGYIYANKDVGVLGIMQGIIASNAMHSGSWDEDNDNKFNSLVQHNKPFEEARTITSAAAYAMQKSKLVKLTGKTMLRAVGDITGTISMVNNGNKFWDNPRKNWINGVEAVGQFIFLLNPELEGAELLFNIGSTAVDIVRDDD